jgi:hypothetical protein
MPAGGWQRSVPAMDIVFTNPQRNRSDKSKAEGIHTAIEFAAAFDKVFYHPAGEVIFQKYGHRKHEDHTTRLISELTIEARRDFGKNQKAVSRQKHMNGEILTVLKLTVDNFNVGADIRPRHTFQDIKKDQVESRKNSNVVQ